MQEVKMVKTSKLVSLIMILIAQYGLGVNVHCKCSGN